MYILKDKDDNIISCAKELSSIEDAKTIMNLPYGVIVELDEANGEGVILDEGRFYLKSQWEEIIKSDEYKYKKAKKEAFDEISVLKEELSNEDYKIIKIIFFEFFQKIYILSCCSFVILNTILFC